MKELEKKLLHFAQIQIPRVLTQMDRDPDSPTFGCFDRNYWHYKIRDFPSSILQQGLFTLRAVQKGTVKYNVEKRIIDTWCIGAIDALSNQINNRGAVSEYYPYEHSYPAAAFSLYAVCNILSEWQYNSQSLFKLVEKSSIQRLASHVADRVEAQATNQQATGIAGLALANKIGIDVISKEIIDEHATRLFESQHEEGWFDEYGGPDFGYLSVTIDALVDYFDATNDSRALAAIDRAIEFIATFIGADGKLPSTLNSRNTDYVVPYGIVKTAARNELAAWVFESLYDNLDQFDHPLWATDDRYHSHYIFASLIRCLPYVQNVTTSKVPERKKSTWLEGCGYWVFWSNDTNWNAYVAAKKGGLVRIHKKDEKAKVENGWRIYTGGKIWTNNWWTDKLEIEKTNNAVRLFGNFKTGKFHTPSPPKHIVLRFGAWILREKIIPILKRLMIFRPKTEKAPQFQRKISINEEGVLIHDKFFGFDEAVLKPSPRQNVRHVASADSFSTEEWSSTILNGEITHTGKKTEAISQWKANQTF